MIIESSFSRFFKPPFLLGYLSVLLFWFFAYDLVRTEYTKLLVLYAALFYLFYKLLKVFKGHTKTLTYFAFGFRAVFIIAIPNLSQDFYRFIWDGRMLLEGVNPYLNTVEWFVGKGVFPVAQAQELFNGMGVLNASHFTNYPPVSQLGFFLAAFFASKSILGSVVAMRLLIVFADFGTLFFGKKLLAKLHVPEHHIFWYILNPFIIIELTGNLHFEGIMVFFLVWSLYLLHTGKWQKSAVVLALSISVKLIPLIFMPLFIQWRFKKREAFNPKKQVYSTPKNFLPTHWSTQRLPFNRMSKLIGFYAIVFVSTLLLFAPFYASGFLDNYTRTIALWFNNFEFNGSLYYLAREIGYGFRNQNEIAIIGHYLSLLVIIFVLVIALFRKNQTTPQFITAMLLVLSFYYFTATTVHPWYLAMLLILSVFTTYKYPLVWSFVIILSYLSYLKIGHEGTSENFLVIILEYVIVYGVFLWEVFLKKKDKEASNR